MQYTTSSNNSNGTLPVGVSAIRYNDLSSINSGGRGLKAAFLTQDERKYGNCQGLQSIEKSFTRLTVLKDRNWSQRDTAKEVYSSPSNFKHAYNAGTNTILNEALLGSGGSKKQKQLNKQFMMKQVEGGGGHYSVREY